MTSIALAFCLLVVAVGTLGVVSPPRMLALVRRLVTPTGLYVAGGIRLAFGAVLYAAAPDTRAPEAMRGLGVFIFVAGLITPFFGLARFRALLDWWAGRGETFLRALGAFALFLGLFLAFVVAG